MITTKQRAYLRSLANGIPAVVTVGKEGVTESVIGNIDEALNAREIVKVSVLETSPVSSKEAIEEVMNKISGCEAVQVIGRKFVVYKRNLKVTLVALFCVLYIYLSPMFFNSYTGSSEILLCVGVLTMLGLFLISKRK